jgi:hypothetical protein
MPVRPPSSTVNVSDQPMISHHRPRRISAMNEMMMRFTSRAHYAEGCVHTLGIQLFSKPEDIRICSSRMRQRLRSDWLQRRLAAFDGSRCDSKG